MNSSKENTQNFIYSFPIFLLSSNLIYCPNIGNLNDKRIKVSKERFCHVYSKTYILIFITAIPDGSLRHGRPYFRSETENTQLMSFFDGVEFGFFLELRTTQKIQWTKGLMRLLECFHTSGKTFSNVFSPFLFE